MNQADIFKVAGVVTAVAGLWTAASAFLSFETTPEWIFFVGTVLTAFALYAVYAALAGPGGAVGLLGFALASVGNLSFLGEPVWGDMVFFVGGAIYALGLILLGITNLRAHVFSRWVGWLWIASVVAGIPGFAVESLMGMFFAIGGGALGAAFVLAGYELWARSAGEGVASERGMAG